MTPTRKILLGDCRETLKELPDNSVQCCVTSPPYFGLRSYGDSEKEIGRERTPENFVSGLVGVFHEVKRVLRDDGVVWVNIGDSYATGAGSGRSMGGKCFGKQNKVIDEGFFPETQANRMPLPGLKPKDLIGIPWMLAFALRADGWYLRSEVTWCKENPMPESVTDRPTSATEKIFLLTKSEKYFYDAEAVRNPPSEAMLKQVAAGYNGQATKLFEDSGVQNASDVKSRIVANARKRIDKQRGHSRRHDGFTDRWSHLSKEEQMACGSNMRNFFLLATEPYRDAHFAVFPREVPRKCILAGSAMGDTILDPFSGSGTTGEVAGELGRNFIGCELYEKFLPMIERRTSQPGLMLA
jgi:DNA modification methylase